MNIIEESFKENKEEKPKRTARIVLAIIVLIVIAIIGIFVAIIYIRNSELQVALNGNVNTNIKDILLFEDGKIYVPIKKFAIQLGYETFNGEYNNKSEDDSSCYVQSNTEVINFSLNSKKIDKLNFEGSRKYEFYTLEEAVVAKQGTLYITSDDASTAFNLSFIYDKEKNRIRIYTLDYLISSYKPQILDYKYKKISEEFSNKQAIFSNMLVVQNSSNKYGVIKAGTGETILEAKYDSIKYVPISGDFIVEDNSKYGLISNNKQTLVQISYDNIELIDTESVLYLVRKGNNYGIVDKRGNRIIYEEYQQIGIDASKFIQNDIKNGYVLVDNLIPVLKDNLWGLFDTSGNLVVDFKYTDLGYIASSNKDAVNLLVIPNYNMIVVKNNGKYGLINASGEEKLSTIADDIYMTIESGKKHYNILANDNVRDAEKYLDRIGIVARDEEGKVLNEKTINNENNTNKTREDNENNTNQSGEDKENE